MASCAGQQMSGRVNVRVSKKVLERQHKLAGKERSLVVWFTSYMFRLALTMALIYNARVI
jgi:hypothetical protein